MPTGVPTTISGTAADSGGGKVARVEVSTDGGRTWVQAQGTERWQFVWTPSATVATTLLSRATDDSGNVEIVAAGVTVTTVAGSAGSRLKTSATSAPIPPPPGGGCSKYSCGDKTLADFQAGSSDQALAVAHRGPGELILKPAKVFEFAALPVDWLKVEPPLGAGSVTFNNGQAIVENAYAYSVPLYSLPRSTEFKGTFTGPNQRAGLGTAFLDVPSWARFGTDATGTQLLAESTNGLGAPASTPLNVANGIGQPHVFRIEWTSTGINYFVDDNAVASHSTVIASAMREVIRDDAADGKALSVRWMRLSPYAATATFQSRIFDRGTKVRWAKARWSRVGNTGSPINLCVRTGNTATPDATWSAFKCQSQMDPSSALNIGQLGRYAQYQTTLSANQLGTVEVAGVLLATGACLDNSVACPAGSSCSVNTCCDLSNQDDAACFGHPPLCQPDPFQPDFDPLCDTQGGPVSAQCVPTPAPSTTVCSPAAGVCQGDAKCDGTTTVCPPNPAANSGTVCNQATPGSCQADAKCSANSNLCPPNPPAPNNTPCSDNDVCTSNDTCQSGVCKGTDTCGGRIKISGGGCVPTMRGTKAEFAFGVDRKPTGKTKGHFTYHDQRAGIKIHGNVTNVVKTGPNTATFSGSCGTGCQFTVDVVDKGEPGKNDMIRVQISGTQTEDTGLQKLCGGNIMFHPGGKHFDHDDDHEGHEFDDDH